MRFIHCTQKLLKELAVVPTDPAVVQIDIEGLGSWYANLLRFNRRKCILFTHEKTLYSFLIPGVLKKDFLNINKLFLDHLGYNLQYEGFGPGVTERVLAEYEEIGFVRTVNKSVLGSMNDLKYCYEAEVIRAGGIGCLNLFAVNQKMNRTPFKAIKYKYPIVAIKEILSPSD